MLKIKKNRNILFLIAIIFFCWFALCFFYQDNNKTILKKYSLEEIFFWENVKLQNFFGPVEYFIYELKKTDWNFFIPPSKKKESKLTGENIFYFSYPLSYLDIDLSVVSIKGFGYENKEAYSKGPNDNDGRITYYQLPKRDKKSIVSFLSSLASWDIDMAINLLSKNTKLVPFYGLYYTSLHNAWDRIIGSWLIYDMAGPMDIDYEIFLSEGVLYFYALLD